MLHIKTKVRFLQQKKQMKYDSSIIVYQSFVNGVTVDIPGETHQRRVHTQTRKSDLPPPQGSCS